MKIRIYFFENKSNGETNSELYLREGERDGNHDFRDSYVEREPKKGSESQL